MHAADIVQAAIVRLSNYGVYRSYGFVPGLCQRIRDDALHGRPDAQRIGEDYGCLDRAEFVHLGGPGKFAERIPDEHGAADFFLKEVALGGHDGGDAGANAIALDQGDVPNANAGYVGDGIQGTG
jgi:hypothetical protein